MTDVKALSDNAMYAIVWASLFGSCVLVAVCISVCTILNAPREHEQIMKWGREIQRCSECKQLLPTKEVQQ